MIVDIDMVKVLNVLNDDYELDQYYSYSFLAVVVVVEYASHPLINKLFSFQENNRLNHLKE
jgi:hypothetical protein